MSSFDYFGTTLTRFDHLYNSTAISERGLEVALAQHWLKEYYWNEDMPGDVLEIGNVTSHYDLTWPRTVVDKYEKEQRWFHGLVKNIDVFDVTGEYSLIMSISTLEHVGYDPPETRDLTATWRAITHLRSLLLPYGKLCVTMPFDREDIDFDALGAEKVQQYIRTAEKPGWSSGWQAVDFVPFENQVYGTVTPWANAVWTGVFSAI